MKKRGKTREVSKATGDIYYKRAIDFLDMMDMAMENENWNGVGLTGVHCAISATDAILASQKGIQNVSQNHADASALLKKNVVHAEINDQSKRLEEIVYIKNIVSYEGSTFTQKKAERIEKLVTRYIKWVKVILNKP
jgi:hypothetical protein